MIFTQSVKEKIPNFLTLTRIIATIPAGFFLFYAPGNANYMYYYGLALFLCIYAAITDFLDGYLARKFQQETVVGAVFDPVADKIFSIWILYALAIPVWLILIMITRDLWVTALRTLWNKNITTSMLAKLKQAILFCFVIVTILLRMFYPNINPWDTTVGYYVNFTTIILTFTVFTGVHYTWLTLKKTK